MTKIQTTIKDVPETMLWTLHNRATEAMRPDGIIKDEKCIEIYKAIDYDYERSFGKAEASHAVRSVIFDREIIKFIAKNPVCNIVNLGEGLETQRYRIKDDDQVQWVSVDLPEAIEVREQFIAPDAHHWHSPVSATDEKWMTLIDTTRPTFITAQGLFMYLEKAEVEKLVKTICQTFEEGLIMFDTIPRWFSKKTMSAAGLKKTAHYITPKMPWGINKNEIKKELNGWSSQIKQIGIVPYVYPRGWQKVVYNSMNHTPYLKNHTPSIVQVHFRNS